MALPTSGEIELKDIAIEFRQQLNLVSLESFLKGAGIVKNIPINRRVPSRNPIKFSDFYGAAYFYLNVSINITPENPSQYANSDDGHIFVTVIGSGGTYQVIGNGKTLTGATSVGTPKTFDITGCSSGDFTITVADLTAQVIYPFEITVGYNGGLGTASGIIGDMNLGQTYQIG